MKNCSVASSNEKIKYGVHDMIENYAITSLWGDGWWSAGKHLKWSMHQCNEPKKKKYECSCVGALWLDCKRHFSHTTSPGKGSRATVAWDLLLLAGEGRARSGGGLAAHDGGAHHGAGHPRNPPHIITGQCLNTYSIACCIGKLSISTSWKKTSWFRSCRWV